MIPRKPTLEEVVLLAACLTLGETINTNQDEEVIGLAKDMVTELSIKYYQGRKKT